MALTEKQIEAGARDLAIKRGLDPDVKSVNLFNTLNWKRFEDEIRAADEAADSVAVGKLAAP